jgi:Fe2+ transport system protein FeoA
MRCQLCGFEFETATMVCHGECPLGSHCNLICCPNCGYQVVDESKSLVTRLLRRVGVSATPPKPIIPLRRRPQADGPGVPLTHIPVGREVEIQSLDETVPPRLAKLTIFGLVPGSMVEVLQRRPSPVIRIGETELALGEEILEQIWVRP